MAEEHLRELPQILERATKIIEELSAPVSNPVINDSDGSGVGQSRPERFQSSPSQYNLPASVDSDSTEPYPGLEPPTHNEIIEQPRLERPEPSPVKFDLLPDLENAETYVGLGPPTYNVAIELAVIEQSKPEPSESSSVQFDILSRPDRTEPYRPARQFESLAATEAWTHHTNDLIELTQASKDLLAEVKFVKDTVRHCNIISGFYQLTRAQ